MKRWKVYLLSVAVFSELVMTAGTVSATAADNQLSKLPTAANLSKELSSKLCVGQANIKKCKQIVSKAAVLAFQDGELVGLCEAAIQIDQKSERPFDFKNCRNFLKAH